jgi:hypothetical protein|tara:strand:+ start:255 stop:668 length:414 start_codon:yes stop_codon:yes gene_type:complete
MEKVYFVKLESDNTISQAIVVSSTNAPTEEVGIAFCKSLYGSDTNWKQTYEDGRRGNYAGIGCSYIENVATMGVASTDIFIQPQPYPSWSISTTAAEWVSPLGPDPTTDEEYAADKYHEWDESAYQADNTTGWVLRP